MREGLRENPPTNKHTKNGAPRPREAQPGPPSPGSREGPRAQPEQARPRARSGDGAGPHLATLPAQGSPLRALRSPGATQRLGAWRRGSAEGTGLRKGREGKSGPTRAEQPHLAPGKHRPHTPVHGPRQGFSGEGEHGPLKGFSGEASSGETRVNKD